MPVLYTAAVFLVVLAIGTLLGHLKLRNLRRTRQGKGFTRENFIAAFQNSDIPPSIPAAVFDHYTSQKPFQDFPLSPDDTYTGLLNTEPDDFEDDAEALLKKLNLQMPHQYLLQPYGDPPLHTLRDTVLWLNRIRQHQPNKSTSV